jgi:uncharacterized protein YbbC (DUF1343 family)
MLKYNLVNIKNTFFIFLAFSFSLVSCQSQKKEANIFDKLATNTIGTTTNKHITVGANRIDKYLSVIKNKKIGVVANQTSVIFKEKGYTHLVDSLISLNINIKTVFAPEHGFRGKADAGEHINNGIDPKTGISIISIYGKNKKPSKAQLKNLELIIFDIQDVGARFYTYISSLHYIMEACAENNIPLLILDRPNPNGHYIDGPILEIKQQSFVGMHAVPIVHGMTIGEYAQMINGEKWLKNGIQCNISIVECKNYNKITEYQLPIKPSPNLPNNKAINLYPSLCLFEGTNVSIGRGTEMQFQIYGSPHLPKTEFQFIPKPNEGAKYPKHENKICYGKDLRKTNNLYKINLEWIIYCYEKAKKKEAFFNTFFNKLAGNSKLQQKIKNGKNAKEIRNTWQNNLLQYDILRKKYLIYL